MIEEIEPSVLSDRQQAGELWLIIDVRESWEIAAASIIGTVHVPMNDLPRRISEFDPKQQTAVLCHSGVRSRYVAEYLAAMGFGRVANISGGIDRWSRTVDPSVARY